MRSFIAGTSNLGRAAMAAVFVALAGGAARPAWGRQAITATGSEGRSFASAEISASSAATAGVDGEDAGTPASGEDAQSDELYKAGTQALDDHQWQAAAEKFNELAGRHADHADEALYWKAYAQQKLGDRASALATLDALKKDYPQSRWMRDALALRMQMRQASGENVRVQDQPDEDLKLLAINSLMNSDPDKAIPILQKFLQGSEGPQLKERALFVLSQSGSPQARQVLGQIARGNSSPELQRKALDDLALFGGKDSRQTLGEIYASSSDMSVKHEILHDFMLGGDRDHLLGAAKSETVPELRVDAIHQLGLLGAKDELWQLYQRDSSTKVRGEILHSFMLAGDRDHLLTAAKSETVPELRVDAIHQLGLVGGKDQLSQLYQQESSAKVKAEILHALFLGGDSAKLIEVARTERDPDLQREAIHDLGLLGSGDTGSALVEMYSSNMDPQNRKAVVHALFTQGNSHALVSIARKETDPTMRREIVSKLALMNSKESTDYMMEILNH
jgi:HEAT repeat protein